MNKQFILLLKLTYFKPSPLFNNVDFDDTQFLVKFYHKQHSPDFDYVASGGKTRTHKTGKTEDEIVIESITFFESHKQDELLPLVLAKSESQIIDLIETKLNS